MVVADVERSVAWYLDLLNLERMYSDQWGGVPAFVGIGGTGLALFPARKNAGSKGSGILHVAFRATRDSFLAAQHQLKTRKIQFSFEDHGISLSIYFSDPDGHQLEITTYELK